MLVQSQQTEWNEAEVESEEPLNVKVKGLEVQNVRLTSKVRELTSRVREVEATDEERAAIIAELEERCNSYQSRLEDIGRFMDRDITELQDNGHEEDRRKDRPVSRHGRRDLPLNRAVRSNGRGLSPVVDSSDELEHVRPRNIGRSRNTGRRRLVTAREQPGQNLIQEDETPQQKPRKPKVLSVSWGPLENRHVLEANYNPEPIPAAVWDQLRSQMARWADLKEDWSQGPRRGKDICAERWSSH